MFDRASLLISATMAEAATNSVARSEPESFRVPRPALRIPELLAPAGDWECARAAVENGADAVYFGLDCGFNARARAANFGTIFES